MHNCKSQTYCVSNSKKTNAQVQKPNEIGLCCVLVIPRMHLQFDFQSQSHIAYTFKNAEP